MAAHLAFLDTCSAFGEIAVVDERVCKCDFAFKNAESKRCLVGYVGVLQMNGIGFGANYASQLRGGIAEYSIVQCAFGKRSSIDHALVQSCVCALGFVGNRASFQFRVRLIRVFDNAIEESTSIQLAFDGMSLEVELVPAYKTLFWF